MTRQYRHARQRQGRLGGGKGIEAELVGALWFERRARSRGKGRRWVVLQESTTTSGGSPGQGEDNVSEGDAAEL